MKPRFKSVLGRYLGKYVRLRRALGYKLESQTRVLLSFDRYLHGKRHRGLLTQQLAVAFATKNTKVSKAECWRRYLFVRQFAEYLAAFDPRTPRFDPKALERSNVRPIIHVYTDRELALLLKETNHISGYTPLRGIALRAMIGLAASTGLRVSELSRLDQSDVDLKAGVLTIRQTKFKKDRLVPMHATTSAVLRNYAAARDQRAPGRDPSAFFVNPQGRRFSRASIEYAMRILTRRIGLRGAKGRGPSFHDLRHRFVVQRIVEWYREGVDVQARLPALATYVGHASYASTAYYITATAELMAIAARRYHGIRARK